MRLHGSDYRREPACAYPSQRVVRSDRVRLMFWSYLVFVAAGLAWGIAVGLAHA